MEISIALWGTWLGKDFAFFYFCACVRACMHFCLQVFFVRMINKLAKASLHLFVQFTAAPLIP